MSKAALAELARALLSKNDKPRSSEHSATVLKKSADGTYWVAIPGGADETPISEAYIEAEAGDSVIVSISNGRARMTGNSTSPSATSRSVGAVGIVAESAASKALDAMIAANSAIDSANTAADAAESASQSASEASVSARQAFAYLLDVEDDWEAIEDYREEAGLTVAEIGELAEDAHEYAEAAAGSATEAEASALSASRSASVALGRLSDVEQVVGTLNWISEHGEYVSAAGTDFDANRMYYGYDSTLGAYYQISNPVPENISSYYILNVSESVQQYIAAHASINDDGLWLTGDSNQYSVLVSSGSDRYDAGMHVISEGRVVAYYGETIVIGDANKAHIEITESSVSFKTADGTEVAYIDVDEDTGESMFYMTRAVVVKDLRFGSWKWADRFNGNMALKWIGESVE